VRIAVNGGSAKTVAVIPADEIGSVTITPDGSRAVYPVFSSRSRQSAYDFASQSRAS